MRPRGSPSPGPQPPQSAGHGLILTLILLSATDDTWARTVRVPTGPLLRVEGTKVTIGCNVRDYEGPAEQNFEWMFSSAEQRGLQILSTFDPLYTDTLYKHRVDTQDIQLQRVSNSEVLLHILQLGASDNGTYTCSTPSTDATFSGNYEASVQLRVIHDTLNLTKPTSKGRQSVNRNVPHGGSFQLSCQASASDSVEHTHLSLAWERQSSSGSAQVLTLTHLGRVDPGRDYTDRYTSGDVRLTSTEGNDYTLTIDRSQPSDDGEYQCVASTWVQAPDGWEKIQEKRVSVAHIHVLPIGLSIRVPLSEVQVNEGFPLNLSCEVSQDSAGAVLTRISWSFQPDSSPGEIRELPGGPDVDPAALDDSVHSLLIPQAWDSGSYTCRAIVWALQSNNTWSQAAEKVSDPIRVLVVSTASVFMVSLNSTMLPLFSEEPTELLCHISGSNVDRLSVSWYYTPGAPPHSTTSPPQLVASLDQDWTLQVGDGYEERLERGELILLRKDTHTFILRLQWTTEADRGNYHCVGISWKPQRDGSWMQNGEVASSPVNVFWKEEESTLAVNAQLMKLVSSAGGTFEMICSVSTKNIPSPRFSVQVTVEKPPSPNSAPVILLSRDGLTKRETDSNTMLEKVKEGVYRFRIYQAQVQDIGAYRCSITAWTQGGGRTWREVRNQVSDPVQLEFQSSGPVFNVTAYTDSPSVYLGDRAEFWCIIMIDGLAMDPEDITFDVSWFAQSVGGSPTPLVTVGRTAQVRHSRRNGTSDVALERISDMEFRLRIYNCEEADARGHYCTVIPWVRSGEGGWNQQAPITSNVVSMNVKMDLLSTFKYPLMIGVGLSLLAGCLACLIGYCTSRLCCKSPPKQDTRREHRRLMSMEMD